MKISVVIPVYNGAEDLRHCLRALKESTRVPDEIIVVDDGSSDGSGAVAIAMGAICARQPGQPQGPGFARNRGVALSSGDLILFVDADVVVHPETVQQFEDRFREAPDLAAAFGSYDTSPTAPTVVSRFKNLLHHYVHQHGNRAASTFWAGCGAIRRDRFLAVGGFHVSFGVEDIELGIRLRAAGHGIALFPEIQCTHRKRWTLLSLVRTDILLRAIPWTRLIVRRRHLPSDLNLDKASRRSAVAVCLGVAGLLLALPAGYFSGWAALGCLGVVAAASFLFMRQSRALHAFFTSHGGRGFAALAIGLYALYLFYSSVVFGLYVIWYRVGHGKNG